ncbi:MAG TPA: hypothetical protein VH575_03110 [Gemmataceae bacterium]
MAQQTALYRRILGGATGLAQLWFDASVLDKYRQIDAYKVIRTDTVGRLRGPQWMLDFGIAGHEDALIHMSVADAASKIPASEREHWATHAAALPASANSLLMQLTRGACIDDGDVRTW